MHVLVIGAAGMVGRKLLDKIAAEDGILGGGIDKLTLVDVIEPAAPAVLAGISISRAADLSDPGVAEQLIASRPD
ncbi:MAG: D-erythronate dehydrogenase, partial [Pyrinomonadaceae bacterium]